MIVTCPSLCDLQATSQDSNGDLDDEESEYDVMMMENAGEVIPSVAKLVSPQDFCSYLVGLLPELLRRTVSQLTHWLHCNLLFIVLSIV